MIKRKINSPPQEARRATEWLNLEAQAEVEVTSEDSAHPVEAALLPGQVGGWRASEPGDQTIRILFPTPRRLTQVQLVFEEHNHTRTQQFVLRASEDPAGPARDIVRQQFNFSPSGGTREEESYRLEMPPVAFLELVITPDISGGQAPASLQQLRLA